tara:strand:- start:1062 stop:1946 length:885 start_codon:yes stop_codon:yes gene_type:complete
MAELTEVETPKNAGFVQSKGGRSANQKRIEKDEAELKALVEGNKPASTEEEASQEETPDTETKEEALSAEERTYKKRYGDLRIHLNKQAEELKEIKAQLEKAKTTGPVRAPSSDEDIEAWTNKYPDIAGLVETIAAKKADEKFAKADKRLQEIDKINADTQRSKAENEIRTAHSDFDELRDSDDFHNWANEQPKWVQDALYENQDDPQSVVRVIDLFKIDNNMDTKSKKRNTKDAASQVKTKRNTRIDDAGVAGQILESQVQKMSAQEYEAKSDDIMEAIRSGKFVYDISGAAR